jgi:hypothetical protein
LADKPSNYIQHFGSEPITKGKIIFLGNSRTEFGDWKKLLNNTSVINRGIAGDNTFGVLARLDEVIARRPDKLFIEIGINDISQNIPVAIITKNIRTIVERVHAKLPGAKVYVLSVLPTNDNVKNEYPDAFNKNEQVSSVNKQSLFCRPDGTWEFDATTKSYQFLVSKNKAISN